MSILKQAPRHQQCAWLPLANTTYCSSNKWSFLFLTDENSGNGWLLAQLLVMPTRTGLFPAFSSSSLARAYFLPRGGKMAA